MELKVSKVKSPDSQNIGEARKQGIEKIASVDASNQPLQKCPIMEGVDLYKQGDFYYVSVEGNNLEVSPEEACLIYEQPEKTMEIIVEKTRKFYFNVAEDNLNAIIGRM